MKSPPITSRMADDHTCALSDTQPVGPQVLGCSREILPPRNPEATKKRSDELAQKVDHQRGGLEKLIARANEALKRSREIVKRSKRRKLWS